MYLAGNYCYGHRTPVLEALTSLATVDCSVTVGMIIDAVGLKSLFVKDLFPDED